MKTDRQKFFEKWTSKHPLLKAEFDKLDLEIISYAEAYHLEILKHQQTPTDLLWKDTNTNPTTTPTTTGGTTTTYRLDGDTRGK